MGEEQLTYSFKEVFDRFERQVMDDLREIKSDVKALQLGQNSNTESLANIKGKLLVWGAVGLAVGTAISGLVVKLVGT